ncbi:S-methyl-5-thioribose-1-phosphate isomerase [Antiquaquibacter soli]|uniref:Methylthioribose-1-phosphate isomerase n=1 Tax=Antiquaquibacter soli TaxID=3064523 RepID=A0ABT9BW71_9MICO|nr:S-methyl-5-thioribose-1-phosphate isomerase [Protaetiibacter sp. WY-16]MDO7883645.1 S-methyl-5-thioribose-1-phosphate isomerase [Protaetiibacter sp. WY-16]
MSALPASVGWTGDAVRIIDQRLLPGQLSVRDLATVDEVVDAIATLAVRGANVIGSAGALGFVLGVRAGLDADDTAARLIAARPTAVNLRVAVGLALDAYHAGRDPLGVALGLLTADDEQTRRIGELGRDELAGARVILTHCNTGRLATTGWGTALGVAYAIHESGRPLTVLATETRPLRQGARLTAWELAASGIDVELLVDSAAAAALGTGRVDAVIVGADRIAANGDTANKVGTRSLAVAAAREGVPFYVAATLNAIDPSTASGADIEIEERSADEVLDTPIEGVRVWNPAFDVTPAELITGIITEAGILRAPYSDSIAKAVQA